LLKQSKLSNSEDDSCGSAMHSKPEVSIGRDWIMTITNFEEFGLDPNCKIFQK